MVSVDGALQETVEIPTIEQAELALEEAVTEILEHVDPSVINVDAIRIRALNDAENMRRFFELSREEQARAYARMSAERAALAETNVSLNAAVDGLQEQVGDLKEKVNTLLIDDVTGLLVRKHFVKHEFPSLVDMLRRTNSKARSLSFVLIDFDDFKEANSKFGLPGGDAVLRSGAEILKHKAFKRGNVDKLVRFGGDEFAAGIPLSPNEDVARICDEKLLQEMRKLRFGEEGDYQQTLSIAVVTIQLTQDVKADPLELLKGMTQLSNDALQKCKQAGKNQVRNVGVVSVDQVLEAATRVTNFKIGLEPEDAEDAA